MLHICMYVCVCMHVCVCVCVCVPYICCISGPALHPTFSFFFLHFFIVSFQEKGRPATNDARIVVLPRIVRLLRRFIFCLFRFMRECAYGVPMVCLWCVRLRRFLFFQKNEFPGAVCAYRVLLRRFIYFLFFIFQKNDRPGTVCAYRAHFCAFCGGCGLHGVLQGNVV
jgi:hypothetical protein